MTEELQLIIPILTGYVAVKAINALKALINSEGKKFPIKLSETYTLYLDVNLGISMLVSLVLAFGALVITGAFTGGLITGSRIAGWFGLLFTVATAIYKGATRVDPEAAK